MPLIGAGTGGMPPARVEAIMVRTLEGLTGDLKVTIVRDRDLSAISQNARPAP